MAEPVAGSSSTAVWNLLPGPDQFKLLRHSVHAQDRHAEFTILTDHQTAVCGSLGCHHVVRGDIDQSEVMLARARLQYQFILDHDFRTPVIFIDTDILVFKDIRHLFDQPFDIGLTVRANEEMPVNGGILFVNNKNPEAARQFFRQLLSLIEAQGKDERNWYGDQYALAQIIGKRLAQDGTGTVIEAAGARILILPSDRYNYSPKASRPNLFKGLDDISVYHFKGRSRTYMKAFWDYRIDPARARWKRLGIVLLAKALLLEIDRYRQKSHFRSDVRRVMRKTRDGEGARAGR
ncbi:MAG: hypothetical protein NWR47_01055 [Aestuariivirgaceae bacterium]|nr:hypothetical protein [Aestuariivirgaceae bacterium]